MSSRFVVPVLIVGLLILVILNAGERADARQMAAASRTPSTVVLEDDVMTAGQQVVVSERVAGDLAAAGRDVTVDADVAGYVMSAGRHVMVNGRIGNDLWAAGETVEIASTIENNAMIAGRTVDLLPEATIAGSARLAGNTIRVDGQVTNDVRAAGSTISIGGDIGGSVRASGEHVTVLPTAVVQGDLVVRSPNPPTVEPGAQVAGSVRHEPSTDRAGWMAWPGFWLWACAAMFVLSAAALVTAPRWPRQVAETLRARPGGSLLAGLAMLIFVPAAIALVAITIVGIPLAIVALAAYVLLFLLSVVFVSYRLGDWILTKMHRADASRWMAILIGVVVLSLAMSIPFVGPMVGVIAVTWGLGAVVLERRAQRRAPEYARIGMPLP